MVRLVTDGDDLYSVTKSPAINIPAMECPDHLMTEEATLTSHHDSLHHQTPARLSQTRTICIQLSLMFSILEFSAPSRLLLILLGK